MIGVPRTLRTRVGTRRTMESIVPILFVEERCQNTDCNSRTGRWLTLYFFREIGVNLARAWRSFCLWCMALIELIDLEVRKQEERKGRMSAMYSRQPSILDFSSRSPVDLSLKPGRLLPMDVHGVLRMYWGHSDHRRVPRSSCKDETRE